MEQKEIFSEFLKEDTFASDSAQSQEKKQEQAPLHFPIVKKGDDDEVQLFWKKLRHFFSTSERLTDTRDENHYPVLLSDFLKREELSTDYPFYLATDPRQSLPLSTLLENTFQHTFAENKALILKENLPRLEGYFRKNCAGKDLKLSFSSVLQQAFGELEQLDVHGEEGKKFLSDLNTFKEALPEEGWLVDFTPNTPFLLLDYILAQDLYKKRSVFVERIAKLKSALHEILAVEKDKSGESQIKDEPDFADSMIEFEKLGQMMPENASEEMSKSRQKRLALTLDQLEKAEDLLLGYHAHIIINTELFQNNKYVWEILFSNSKLMQTENGESCITAFNTFREHIDPFTRIIAAVRVAELELEGNYKEEVHDGYFDYFNWRQLSDEEFSVFPPVILVAHTQEMLDDELAEFSRLLASNKPVKVFAVKHEHPFEINANGNKTLDFYTFKQELGALAVAHRDAFTFQEAMNNPANVLHGLNTGLLVDSPAVFNVLAPWNHSDQSSVPFLNVSAAVESRYFPIFTYDHEKGEQWGSRFDISANPQADKLWPVYPIEVQDQNGESETIELSFTYADYYALEPSHQRHLMLIPPAYWTADLTPLSDYLQLPVNELYGKIPFIWMVNEKMELQKVAIPFSVIIACKERLDYWNFIQELGGINSFHVDNAIQATKEKLAEEKEKEVAQLKREHQKEVEEVRSSAAGEAMEHLASILLNLENLESEPVSLHPEQKDQNKTKTTTQENPTEDAAETKKEEKEDEEEALVSAEPWLETMRCTSCNECTDMFPAVFKYNEDKQAYIADASNATYAQLVQAAEECPAACIHPGLPENPDEEGMDKLIKRAEPFN